MSRRSRGAWTLTALAAVSLVLVGCAGSGGSSSHPSPATGQVDAQVFSDVVEWAFPLPGSASQGRVRRVNNFTNNMGYKACGAKPAPLDYVEDTGGDEYPDLELIRTRGLGPIYDSLKYYHLKQPYGSHQSPRCIAAQQPCKAAGHAVNEGRKDADALAAKCRKGMKHIQPFGASPVLDNAFNAGIAWQDKTMLTVANSEVVLEAAKPAAQCLRRGSGLHVTDDNPSDSFLGSVDVAYFRRGSTVTRKTMWAWSRLYADCAAPYFAVVKSELLKRRPAMVERYREQLQALAAALVKPAMSRSWFGLGGRFPAVVLGAAAASLVWLVVVTTTVTSPGQARAERAAPKLPTPAATLTKQVLRQTSWRPCERRSEIVDVVAPTPPPGDRSVVTAVTTAGTKATTGTILARVSGRPLIAVVTDAPLYRDLTLGAHGPDVLGLERSFAAAGLIGHADDVVDAATLAAWHRLDDTAPADRIPLDSIVSVPADGRVGDVSAGVGDGVKPSAQIMQVRAGGPFFECRARKLPDGLTARDLIFEVDGKATPVAELQQRPATDDRQGLLRIRPGRRVSARDARVGIVSADSDRPVLTAPLSAIRVAPDGSTSVVVIENASRDHGKEATKEVEVTLGVTAQGVVALTGDGLTAGTQVQLFDPTNAPTGADLSAR